MSLKLNEVFGHVGDVLTEAQKRRGALIHAFQQIQEEHNYLPEEELRKLSKNLDVPLSDVYSTATFYKQFYFTPRGKKITVGCIGCCGLAPVATVNEDIVGEIDMKKLEVVVESIKKGEDLKSDDEDE
jgi:NADH:ubiquinone oxidoreductase subunit E